MGLPQALALAERGLRVFPLAKNSKRPVFDAWHNDASSDIACILEMFTSVRGRDGSRIPAQQDMEYNVGILTDGMLVVDVDVKDGRAGRENFLSHSPDLNTFSVRTPSGGEHYYYDTLGTSWSNTAGTALGEGVDTRSYHGFVVGPGSVIDGKTYDIINEAPHAPVPYSIVSKLRIPKDRKKSLSSFADTDSDACVAHAIQIARDYPQAYAGSQSQEAYFLACRMRDCGVSDLMATSIMSEEWGVRCEPPLEYDDIGRRVENAYQYARGTLGADSAAFIFSSVTDFSTTYRQKETASGKGTPNAATLRTVPEDEDQDENVKQSDEVAPHTEPKLGFAFGNMTPRGKLTPRPWIVNDLLLSGDVTTMAAEGSAGKTTFLLNVAVHLAAGAEDILGYKNRLAGRPIKSIIHSAEDDIVELSRRIEGVCQHYGYVAEDIAPHIALSSGKDRDLRFAYLDSAGSPATGTEALDQIISLCNEGNVGLIGLDPLTNLHSLNENDSVQMTYLMSIFNKLAKETGASVLLMHHTHKSADGTVASSRGSSAIMNSSRIGLVLNRVLDKDAIEHGISLRDAPRITWIGEGKSNVSERKGQRKWYIMQSIKLWTEDTVGVPVRYNARAAQDGVDMDVVNALKNLILSKNTSSVPIKEAINYLRNVEGRDMFIKCSASEGENILRQIVRRCASVVDITANNTVALAGASADNVVSIFGSTKPRL